MCGCAGDALSGSFANNLCVLAELPPPPTSLRSKDQAEMDPADMEDVEDVEEEETGEDENSKGWYLHSVFHGQTQSIGNVKRLECR